MKWWFWWMPPGLLQHDGEPPAFRSSGSLGSLLLSLLRLIYVLVKGIIKIVWAIVSGLVRVSLVTVFGLIVLMVKAFVVKTVLRGFQ